MSVYRFSLVTSCMLLMTLPAYGGTLVESTDQEGGVVVTRIEGNMVRTDMVEQPGTYVLFDLDKEKAYMVDDSEHMVMDLSTQMWDEGQGMPQHAAKHPKARLVEQGKGPTIAGYSTMHYKVMAGDEFCGDEYLSLKAMKETNMQEVGELMTKMARRQEQMAGMAGLMQDACDAADLTLYETYLKHGMPLRSVDKDGKVSYEIKRVQTNASIPAGFFDLPRDYPVMTMEQMMQQHTMSHREQMQNMPEGMPDMSGMDMDDMQKMREQMEKQMQEMMRQMGRDADN